MNNIIITKTPLRISFIGGGSDLEDYYLNNDHGRVISTTIDKYVYVTVHKRYDDLIRASYSKTELVKNVNDMNHELIRESLKFMNIDKGIEITSISDLTAHGTGLGSSSAYTVGVLNALAIYQGKQFSRYNLANNACSIEIEKCNQPIGRQDQYASAFGGLNEITFTKNCINVNQLNVKTKVLNNLSDNLLLFDTGIKRKSGEILKKQKSKYSLKNFKNTSELVNLIPEFKNCIVTGNINDVGKILNESWKIKRDIVKGITNSEIDSYYNLAISAGASGGKLCGAGGGGFLLFYVDDKFKQSVRNRLQFLKELNFTFDHEGAKVL